MARLPKDVVVTSRPVQTFLNGDYLYVELSRMHSHYDCLVKMARSGNPANSIVVAKAQGKTIREAEDNCYTRALNRCPRLPRPPYLRRGSGASRTRLKPEERSRNDHNELMDLPPALIRASGE